ncbi:MAG: phage minor head protein [Chloroflexota bacterium]
MRPAAAAAARELAAALDVFLEADARRRKARATAPHQRALQAAMAKAFRRQGSTFLALLGRRAPATEARRSARNLREALPEEEVWRRAFGEAALATLVLFEGPLRQYAALAMLDGARAAIAELRIRDAFELSNPRAVAWLETHPALRVAGINDATRDEIGRIISEGAAAGRSYSAIAREIRAAYRAFAVGSPLEHIRSRAELVAVTEIGDAYEAGNRIVADGVAAAGLEMEKSWLDVGDRRVDPDCVSNAAQGWIPIDAAFGSGHQQPTAHPGCRCTTLYRRKPS